MDPSWSRASASRGGQDEMVAAMHSQNPGPNWPVGGAEASLGAYQYDWQDGMSADLGCSDSVGAMFHNRGMSGFNSSMQDWDPYVDTETLEQIGPECVPTLLRSFRNQVWELSKSARYCRLVQHALELADEQGQITIVYELRSRVVEATMDPHANHVLQKAIELMRPTSVMFVLYELMEHKKGTSDLAKHRYGCRVLERLIEHFPTDQLAKLVDDMMCDAKTLIGHPFGNFVMQHLLEHGEDKHRKQLVDVLSRTTQELRWAAGHQHAASVLDKALSYGPPEQHRALAAKVLSIDGLLLEMACQRGGFAATQRLFKVVGSDAELLLKARQQLAEGAESLVSTKHGRALAAQVYPELLDQPVIAVPSPSRSRQLGGGHGHGHAHGHSHGGGHRGPTRARPRAERGGRLGVYDPGG